MFALKLLLLGQFLGPLGGVDNMPSGSISTATFNAIFGTPGSYASPAAIELGGPVTDTRASTATYLTGVPGRGGHVDDSSTYDILRFDEASGGLTSTHGLLNSTVMSSSFFSATPGSTAGQISGARVFSGGGTGFFTVAVPASLTTLLQTGSYTMERLAYRAAHTGSYAYACMMIIGDGTSPARLLEFDIQVGVNKPIIQWSTGSGTYSTTTSAWVMPQDAWFELQLRVTVTGATRTLDFKAWDMTGTLVNNETWTGLTAPNVSFGGTQNMHTGANDFISDVWDGMLDDTRFSNRARTDAELTASAQLVAGTGLRTASANALRVQPNGALLEPNSTNIALQSGDLSNAAWTTFNTLAITANTCQGPTGALDMALIDSTAAGAGTQNQRYQLPTAGATASITNSAWLNVQSGSHTGGVVAFRTTLASCSCTCACLDGTACTCTATTSGASCAARATVDRLCRLSATATDTGTSTNGEISTFAGVDGVSNDKLCIGYAQAEVLPFATSYIATAGTATARAAETATVNAVGAVGAATGSGVFTFSPLWSSATAGGDRVLLSTTGLVVKWLNSTPGISITAGGATATSSALTWSALSSHVIRYRYGGSAGVGACVQVDGASEVCAGTFTTITPTNPLYINGDASSGSGGSISGIKICPANSACN